MRHDFFSVITGHMCERMKLYRQYNKVRLSRVLFVMSWMVCSIDWTVLNLAGENWSECAPYCDLKTNLLTTLKVFTNTMWYKVGENFSLLSKSLWKNYVLKYLWNSANRFGLLQNIKKNLPSEANFLTRW